MKVEEIKLHLDKNREHHVRLNITKILADDVNVGFGMIADARKNISTIVDGYNKAIQKFNSILPRADQYIEMAKALGDKTIETSLQKTKKEAIDMVKVSNQVIAKLKSL